MRSQKPLHESRAGERGAALITAVLLSLLLLAAGGTLILTATMTSITARDSTAEMQAYYAAEAGVARTLEVLRGNAKSTPVGTKASFRNVLCTPALWTTTAGGLINVTTDGSARFQVTEIKDPDSDTDTNTNCLDATYKPDRLRIRVLGTGPSNSQKKMEIVVSRYTLDYPVNAVVTLPNGSGTPLSFLLGDSNVTKASGVDASGTCGTIPAFAINNNDYNTTNNVIDGCDPDGSNCGNGPNVSPADPAVLVNGNTPSFLQSVEKARLFLYGPEGMENLARNQGRYFTSGADAIASTASLGASNSDGVLTFVDGDLTLEAGNPSGQGTLIVTGKLTLKGSFNWNGVIMVLGHGDVLRNGGGQGNIYGAMFVAKFAKVGLNSDVFQAPTFDTTGGGSANIQYSCSAIDMAKSVGGHSIKGVREY
jgi:Tfp pilus assembly protein PilX